MKESWSDRLRHMAYAAGWKKFEPAWDMIIKAKRASSMLPAPRLQFAIPS